MYYRDIYCFTLEIFIIFHAPVCFQLPLKFIPERTWGCFENSGKTVQKFQTVILLIWDSKGQWNNAWLNKIVRK